MSMRFLLPLNGDSLSIIIHRRQIKVSPFQAGRDHIHHILMGVGFSEKKVLAILLVISMLMAAIGIIGEVIKVPEPLMFYGILAMFGLYYLVAGKLRR